VFLCGKISFTRVWKKTDAKSALMLSLPRQVVFCPPSVNLGQDAGDAFRSVVLPLVSSAQIGNMASGSRLASDAGMVLSLQKATTSAPSGLRSV
jgi:hypothetical protein